MQVRFSAGRGLEVQCVAAVPEAYRIFEQPGECLSETFPGCSAVVLVDLEELCEEMEVSRCLAKASMAL